jgi:predicted nucleic acid-binding protein
MTTLVDAGPLIALFNADERRHAECAAAITRSTDQLVTCEAAISEACYVLRDRPKARQDLLLDVRDRLYIVEYQLAPRAGIVAALMAKYASVPMSLADACLVDLAEIHNTGRVLTLDSDFGVYRWNRNRPFELLLDI